MTNKLIEPRQKANTHNPDVLTQAEGSYTHRDHKDESAQLVWMVQLKRVKSIQLLLNL